MSRELSAMNQELMSIVQRAEKMERGIFITGTDTGVGKTYVARGIARTFRRDGINVGVMKPAETGCRKRNGQFIPADAISLMKAAGVRDALELVNPYRFSKPLAPWVTAELEGKHIDPIKILNTFHALSRRHNFMIVEGAGGIMVPLSRDYLYLDLAEDLRLPVVIVARPGLGTINHTLLTISVLKERRIKIAGVVINHSNDRKEGLAEKTSPAVIEAISGVRILGVVQNRGVNFDAITNTL
jgi:dethiobiotin synthetase